MTTGHASLPPPYTRALSPADLTRYGDVLPARQATALRLRLTGFTYAQIGNRLGVGATQAYYVVQRACDHLWHVKRRTEAQLPQVRRELGFREEAPA
jgi:hypothetical protein